MTYPTTLTVLTIATVLHEKKVPLVMCWLWPGGQSFGLASHEKPGQARLFAWLPKPVALASIFASHELWPQAMTSWCDLVICYILFTLEFSASTI